MKFEEPKNVNYAAQIVRVPALIPLENCDNVVAINLFGFQAIVSKDTVPGELGVMFPAESQLSEDYCKQNNLFRHAEKNMDETKTGYIEDSRRVKAVKFRKHTSSCLFMPLESLAYLGVKPKDLNEGDVFDAIKGVEVCRKYLIREPRAFNGQGKQFKRFNRVDTKFIPEHIDTENYFRNDRNIHPEAEIIVTQKLHGTSIRVAHTVVARKLNLAHWIFSFSARIG